MWMWPRELWYWLKINQHGNLNGTKPGWALSCFSAFCFHSLVSSPLALFCLGFFIFSKERPYLEMLQGGWAGRTTAYQMFQQIDILLATQHIKDEGVQLEARWPGMSSWKNAEGPTAFLALGIMGPAFTSTFQWVPSLFPQKVKLLCCKQGGSFEERIAIIFYMQTH